MAWFPGPPGVPQAWTLLVRVVLQGHLAVLLLDLLQRWAVEHVEHSVHKSEATKTIKNPTAETLQNLG